MYTFGTATSSSSPSNSLPPTPTQGAVINAPVVLDTETTSSPFGPLLRKRLDSTSLRLPPPLFELPFSKEALAKVVAPRSETGEFYLQHPRRVESQIQLASANGAGQDDDEFAGFSNSNAYRRSQSSPVHYRKPKNYDEDEEDFGESLRLTSSVSRGHDAFDLLESELNDPDNEFAGDLELGRRGLPNACIFVANLAMHRADAHLQQSVFEYFKQFGERLHVKIRRDQKNMPYSFVQYESEANACRAIKEGRGALLDNRRIRCEAARVNRTLVFTKFDASDFTKDEARALIKENYGPFEMFQIVSDKITSRMYCFVKFIYRIDAIECYGEMRHSEVWNVDWENDHARGHNSAHLPDVAVEVDHTSIFVGNLNPELVQQLDLTVRFSQYGHVLDCNLINTKRHEKSERSTTRNAFAFIKYESEESAIDAIASEHGMYYLGKYLHVQKRELHDKYYRNIPQQPTERYSGGGQLNGYQPSSGGYHPNQQQQNFRPRLALQIPGTGPPAARSNNDASLSEIVGIATRISLQLMGKRGMNQYGNVNQQEVVNQVIADMNYGGDINQAPSTTGSGPSSPQTPRNYNGPSTPSRGNFAKGGYGGSPFTTPRNNRGGYGGGGYGINNNYQNNLSPTSTVCMSPHYQMPNRGFRKNFSQRPLNSEMTGGGVYLPGNNPHFNGRQPITLPVGSYSPVGPYPLTFSPQANHIRNGSNIYIQQEEQQAANHHSRNNSAYLRQHRMNLQRFGAPPQCQLNPQNLAQKPKESQAVDQPSPSNNNDE